MSHAKVTLLTACLVLSVLSSAFGLRNRDKSLAIPCEPLEVYAGNLPNNNATLSQLTDSGEDLNAHESTWVCAAGIIDTPVLDARLSLKAPTPDAITPVRVVRCTCAALMCLNYQR